MNKCVFIFVALLLAACAFAGQNSKDIGTAEAKAGRLDKAYAAWLPLAENGDPEVQEAIALLLVAEGDLGVDFKPGERTALARKWLGKSALNGQKSAMKWLSDAFANGWLNFSKDTDAAKCWRDASEVKVVALSCQKFLNKIGN